MKTTSKKILLIEDDPTTLLILNSVLESEGFVVQQARNGLQGIDLYNENVPDLVITDLNMPEASGLDVIIHIRLNLKKRTPIVVLSAIGQEKMVMRAFELGATDFQNKPLQLDKMLGIVGTILSKDWE